MSAHPLTPALTPLTSGPLKPWVVWCAAVAMTPMIGFVDYKSGYEVSAVLLYSAPILLMVWHGDRISAVFIALLCALTWWWADEASGHHYTEEWYQIWETSVRLVYFLLFVVGGTAIKSRLEVHRRNEQLEQQIIRMSEREQQRIGRDLHDGICQYFAAIGCSAGTLRRSLGKQGHPQTQRAGEIEDLIMKGVAQTRDLARGLFPVENEAAGLQSALKELAASSSRLLDLECTFVCDTPAPIFENTCATHLYRIAQESVSNASRHGRATQVAIRLAANAEEVALTIEDNGIGLPPPEARKSGMGLNIMRYRAGVIEARFEVTAPPTGGTRVRCYFSREAA